MKNADLLAKCPPDNELDQSVDLLVLIRRGLPARWFAGRAVLLQP
jgi:hypothetical protein